MSSVEERTIPARTVTNRKSGEKVEQASETRYLVRWRDPEGRQRSRTFKHPKTSRAKSIADAFAKSVERQLEDGEYVAPKATKQTLGAYFAEWTLTTPHTSRTQALYRQTLDSCDFAHKPMNKITDSDIRAWLVALSRDGRTAKNPRGQLVMKKAMAEGTIRMHAARLRVVLEAAVSDRKLARSPWNPKSVRAVVGGRVSEDGAVRIESLPEAGEVATLIHGMKGRYVVGLYLASFAGLRSAELRALRIRDFNHLGRVLRIRGQMVRERQADGAPERRVETMKTKASRAEVEVSRELADVIQAHLERWCPDPTDLDAPLMPTERGQHVDANTLGHYFRQARKSAGLGHVRLHDLRHFAVSSQILAGATIADAQKFARHASASMTLGTYTHAFAGYGERNAARSEVIFAGVFAARSASKPAIG